MTAATFSPGLKNVISLLSQFQTLTKSEIVKNAIFSSSCKLTAEEIKLVRHVILNNNPNQRIRPINDLWY
jgi:hypothetical protein